VVLVKSRKYGTVPATNLSSLVASPSSPVNVLHHTGPGGASDTFLRARVQFQMDVLIATGDVPSESWWPSCSVTLLAFWTPTSATTLPNANGTSEHYLGSAVLGSTIVPSPTAPDEYTVLWRMERDLILQTSRQGDPESTGPSFNVGIVVYDTQNALDGTFSAIRIDYECRGFSLWGTPP
jgi:hypothetical protein